MLLKIAIENIPIPDHDAYTTERGSFWETTANK